ncbi:helix-turn-helix domain-containing protein [Paucibacter sp. AS339]|uniref:helix-turn-helix domain-containing protein n=1 Tax=Paucibacter hankyongi TaxID=3133434 RepID=UPI0030B295D2
MLHAEAPADFQLHRYPVGPALAPWLDFHWLIEWDLPPGQVHVQRVLPYPNTHLVFEAGLTALHGVARGVFVRRLEGRGRVHGLRFKCGGLRPWLNQSVQSLTGRQLLVHQGMTGITAARVQQVEAALMAAHSDQQAVDMAEALLLTQLPAADSAPLELDAAVQQVMRDPGLIRVAQLQALLGLSERALQRSFAEQIGVSPKWVIQRARLQDALQALAQAECPSLAELAVTLGFCDQAHFSRCFRQTTGQTPALYRRQFSAPASA